MNKRLRENSIIMHISSLSGPFGIGTFGEEARLFVDKLVAAEVTYWQVLPFTQPGAGDSPYSSTSAFAGNIWFIDPRGLAEDGLLTWQEVKQFEYKGNVHAVDYDFVRHNSESYLRLAYTRADNEIMGQVLKFVKERRWLHDYGAFTVIRNYYRKLPWWEWDDIGVKTHDNEALNAFLDEHLTELHYIYFTQWLFDKQWIALLDYANNKGVGFIGDMPFYVAADSSDIWSNMRYFLLDEDLNMEVVSGVPPDYFSEDGQLWGNPIYDWDELAKDDFAWWVERIRFSLEMFNRVRIDHFRGFESYWAVPFGETTARHGEWRKGPAMSLFNTVRRYLGDVNIIAEDLGDINDNVRDFLEESGFPGMKVLQFAFNPYFDDSDLPHSYINNLCAYTGTHDNNTSLGWICAAGKDERNYALEYIGYPVDGDWMGGGANSSVCKAMVRAVWSSVAFLAVAPMQDFLGYGSDARMNIPGVPSGNWSWRVGTGVLEGWDIKWLKRMNIIYGRNREFTQPVDRTLLTSTELDAAIYQARREDRREPVLEQLSKLDNPKSDRSAE